MEAIDKIISGAENPFESELTPGNFWQEKSDTAWMVDSIHQEVLEKVTATITQMNRDKRSRSLIIAGDSGSGKSYLLGRIKRTLNQKAFFAYITPWPNSKYIWRHVLRQTVDSLVCTPEGENESQLILWLKGLSAFKNRGIQQWILGERGAFINELRAIYPSGIYNARSFFGVLYDLTNSELYPLACDWLRGDSLGEDELRKLKVGQSIESEDAAKNILGNFGKIAADALPIVLCFDQLDNISRLNNDLLDLQALFNINTTIHNEYYRNFLVIISIITDTWRCNKSGVRSSDLARVGDPLILKNISLEQAHALWEMRLHPIHSQLPSSSDLSPLYPLTPEQLESSFPRGKVLPRNALVVGSKLFNQYQQGLVKTVPQSPNRQREQTEASSPPISPKPETPAKAFQEVWNKKHQKVRKQITKTSQISEPELIKMLQEVLEAFNFAKITPNLLKGRYSVYSFSYQHNQNKIGIVWTENPNLSNFCTCMKACYKVTQAKTVDRLKLLRIESVGNPHNKGYKIYKEIFNNNPQRHLRPNLHDIQYLATYHQLVNGAKGRELLVSGEVISFKKLKSLIRESGILSSCSLLRELGVIKKQNPLPQQPQPDNSSDIQEVKTFLLNRIKSNQIIGRKALTDLAQSECPGNATSKMINLALQKLIQENQIKILNPQSDIEDQSICWVPNS